MYLHGSVTDYYGKHRWWPQQDALILSARRENNIVRSDKLVFRWRPDNAVDAESYRCARSNNPWNGVYGCQHAKCATSMFTHNELPSRFTLDGSVFARLFPINSLFDFGRVWTMTKRYFLRDARAAANEVCRVRRQLRDRLCSNVRRKPSI